MDLEESHPLVSPLLHLSNEILIKIFMQLNGRDLISLTETNARLQALITGTQKLTDKFELKLSSREKSMDALKNMISEGRKFKQLTMMDLSPELRETKLSIVLRLFVEAEGFTDYLRAFNMTNCDYVDPEGFVIFLKQFPKLESIKLDNIKFFSSNRNFPIIPTNTYDPHIILNLGFLPYMVPKFEHLKSLIIITSNSDTLSVSCSKIFQNAVQLENISTNSFFISFITDYSNLKSVRIDNTTYRTNFFTDDIQKRIKFRLKSFAYRGIRFQSVPGRDNVSRFLSKQTEITELSLHIGNVSNAVLKQIVMMPQLKKLNLDLSAAANHYSEEDDHEYDDLDIPFEDVLTVRNETLEELKLYWRNDESCIKLINLFPNVKILHSSLKMPENDSFTVQFPQLTKLQEVYLNYRSELIDLNTIQIGPTLLELKFEGQLPPNSLEALSKFAKDHPNIRKLSFMSGFKLLEQQQLICDLKRLENLKIVYMWPDYDQKFIDHVCDCTNLKNIRMSDLPINLSNQIIKRFHTDADRPACDLHTTFEPSNSSFHVAICEDAKTKAPNFFYYGEIAESL